MKKPAIKCERCNKSTWCNKLRPCKDFAPEQSSNFSHEVNKLETSDIEFLNPEIIPMHVLNS